MTFLSKDSTIYNSIIKEEKEEKKKEESISASKEERRNISNRTSVESFISTSSSDMSESALSQKIKVEKSTNMLFSFHHVNDMIENTLICAGCDNVTCTCDSVSPIFSSHPKSEMKMKQSSPDPQSGNKLEKVDTDKSDNLVSYVCTKDGLTTLEKLGTPVATIKCDSCGSRKFMQRIFDDQCDQDPDRNVPANTRMETIAGMKPQFRQHLRIDDKTGEQVLVTAPDDERGLGSVDPRAIMGYTQPKAIMEAYNRHYDFIDKNTGKWTQSDKSVLESLEERVRDQRIFEEDVFAKEPNGKTSMLVLCDVPSELKADINNDKGMESFYMDMPDTSRRVSMEITLPENKAETYKRVQRQTTKDNIIQAIATKTAKLRLFGTHDITDFQINTCNKHLGVKPLKGSITYEELTKHMKAYFYARKVDNKDLMETSKRKIVASSIEIPKMEIPTTSNTEQRGVSNMRFHGDDSPFKDIPSYENVKDINVYDYEPTKQMTSETYPSPRIEIKSNNSSQLQQYLETNRNDNSSGVVESTPSPLSNNQINLSPSHQSNDMVKQDIFVFGSNLKGIHGAGSALSARQEHGAILGQGIGLQGNSYAIPTKETPYKSLPLEVVGNFVKEFITFAKEHDDMTFNITRIGCGRAGFTPEQIAPLFKDSPKNVNLPDDFISSHQSNDMLKLGIVGASNPSDDNVAYEKIKKYVQNLQKENPEIEIVSGGASGVDSIAVAVAKDLNIPFKIFEPKTPNWDGFKARNLQIAEYTDKVVSFANEFKTKKCYHCERVGKDNNHEKTAGCYTGYNHGEYETIILGNRLE